MGKFENVFDLFFTEMAKAYTVIGPSVLKTTAMKNSLFAAVR